MPPPGAVPKSRLAEMGRLADGAFCPVEAALVLAAMDRPDARIEAYHGYLDELAAEVRVEAGLALAADAAIALAEVIGRRHRYRGDERDDDEDTDSSLMDLIDSRRGPHGMVGLLTLAVARRAGFAAEALAFPIRFLIRLECGGERLIVDPARPDRVVGAPEMRALLKAANGLAAELEPGHYAAMGNRDVLLRLRTEAKLRLLRTGEVAAALKVVETMLLFAPDAAMLWREAGLMHMRLDNPHGAVAALEQFVARTPNAQARARTLALLAELKGHLH